MKEENIFSNSTLFQQYIDSLNLCIARLDERFYLNIENALRLIIANLESGNKILLCGNGGSAADSQHFAAELVNAMEKTLERPALPAIALTTDSSVITSISNDFGFENIFSRQVEALGKSGDSLIGFTTSGKSKNVLKSLEAAKTLGINTIVFCGEDKSALTQLSDCIISVPSRNTQNIQEVHLIVYHYICKTIEEYFSKKGAKN